MNQVKSVIDSIARCFDTGDYSDLTIKCCDRAWKVHRLVVCSQSKVLHAACMAGFKETHTNVVELDDDDPTPVEIMLRYFYTGKFNELIEENEELCPKLQVQVLTYNLADKYDVPALMELARKLFKSTLNKEPTTEEYLAVVSDIYTTPTPDNALRTLVVEHARVKLQGLMRSSPDLVRATMEEIPEFAFDVLQLFVNEPLRGHCYSCGSIQSAEALRARCKKCGKGGVSLQY